MSDKGVKLPAITPHLTVKGGIEAIKYYEKAFGAEECQRMLAQDGKRLLHAVLLINDSPVMLCDEFSEHDGGTKSPQSAGGASVAIHLELKKPKHVDELVAQATDAGGTVLMPVADQFWGARYGRLRDPFGHVWSIGAPLKKKDKHNGKNKKKNKHHDHDHNDDNLPSHKH